ncbi:MAG: MOSC N-terminal beta barrel domain-containing protein [Alphaproteobacteria bacterium]
MTDITIQSLHIYPIKSCGAVDVKQAFVSARGLTVGNIQDRSFMLVHSDGSFITQREAESLARVRTSLPVGNNPQVAIINAEGMNSFALDPRNVSPDTITVQMHNKMRIIDGQSQRTRETTRAHIMNGPGTEWFRNFLNMDDVLLVHQTETDMRYVNQDFATQRTSDTVSLADGYQILVTSMASLRGLNSQLDGDRPMKRFRPNIVVDGVTSEKAENTWAEAVFGEVTLAGVKPCDRCKVTGIDQITGIYEGSDIISALSLTSRVNYVQGQSPVRGVIFGENFSPVGEGPIRVGDQVKIKITKPMPVFL